MKQLKLRLDDELHADLVAKAKEDGRSLNRLINELLAQRLDREAVVTLTMDKIK